jgi:hypothetical protein
MEQPKSFVKIKKIDYEIYNFFLTRPLLDEELVSKRKISLDE